MEHKEDPYVKLNVRESTRDMLNATARRNGVQLHALVDLAAKLVRSREHRQQVKALSHDYPQRHYKHHGND